METIRAVVRNLVFLVLLAGFLEMLLPLKETRRFLQVILGMFVLVTVLNPVVSFFRQTPILSIDISRNLNTGRVQLYSILEEGKSLQQANLERARSTYVKQLEEQVAAVARLVPGVEAAKAQVYLVDDQVQQAAGIIERIVVTVHVGTKKENPDQIKPVERISIKEGSSVGSQQTQLTPTELKEISGHVHDTVASLFGLRPEQVVVNVNP